ncbi:hypothetical protein ACLVWU_17575 [Bdellovibrio sp. HCB290]|uniref:hypothetical protein n=1 Tax=Bdellovibrio sp. HCB290 TaxID=3394356 RepID=UPI0039B3BB51
MNKKDDRLDLPELRQKVLDMRSAEIGMHGLKLVDEEFIFVYDETNNFRKLYLRDGGFNVQSLGDFVLGGVMFPNGKVELPVQNLRERMTLDKGIKDIKLKHICRGGAFADLLQSKKMAPFLDWFDENDLILHFSRIEPFYWSVVDIVDSIACEIPKFIPHVFHLKSDLVECLFDNLETTIQVFERYRYPCIQPNERSEFIEAILQMVVRSLSIEDFNKFMLLKFLEDGLNVNALPFIDEGPGEIPGMLIEKFGHYYRHRIVLFKNSIHLFDEEVEVKTFLENDTVLPAFPELRFSFLKSEDESAIQVSDMMMGLLGKLFAQVRGMTLKQIDMQFEDLSDIGKKNLETLAKIVNRSNDISSALQHHICSAYDRKRFEHLLDLARQARTSNS